MVPPGTGICHQVNLEYLVRVVFATPDGRAYCDTLVGTDSHTTMVNGLGVLGWGVGGIEAEAAMLGQPLSMLLPPVVGLRLFGRDCPRAPRPPTSCSPSPSCCAATAWWASSSSAFGPGRGRRSRSRPGPPSATCRPEYGATCTIFPIDEATIDYLRFTGRDEDHLALVEAYAKEQGLWHEPGGDEPVYSETVELDLSTVEPSLAGPARPQDRVSLAGSPATAFRGRPGREPVRRRAEPGGGAHAAAPTATW